MRSAIGIFGGLAGAIVVALVGRYGYATSDTAFDGAIAAFFFGVIAVGGIAAPAAAVHLFRGATGWAKTWGVAAGLIAAIALAVNLSNSLGAIAGRADKTLAERTKAADNRKDDRAALARVAAERAAMSFTPATAETVQAAREAVASAERTAAAECGRGDPRQRGNNCRIRETAEQATRDALASVLANRAATEKAAKLDSDAAAIRVRLDKAPPVASVNPLAETLGRVLSLPDETAATAQQVAMVVVVELLIAFALIAWELLAPKTVAPPVKAAELSEPPAPRSRTIAGVALIEPPAAVSDTASVARFILACLPRAMGEEASWGSIYHRYQRWCSEQTPPLAPLGLNAFGEQFAATCARVNIPTKKRGNRVYCVDVQLVA